MRLQHVSVPMPPGGLDEARVFYCGLLGLAEKPVPAALGEGLLWVEAGPGELELHLFPDADGPNERQHFALAVDGLDPIRARLEAAGHEVADAVPIPNRPRFYTRDPFGNRIEVTTILGSYA